VQWWVVVNGSRVTLELQDRKKVRCLTSASGDVPRATPGSAF
jgi:hypothetical protein